jgi:hypothetical protein
MNPRKRRLTRRRRQPWLCLRSTGRWRTPASLSSTRADTSSSWTRNKTYRLDLSGIDLHDADACVDELLAKRISEGAYGSLGGAVDATTGVGLTASNAANVDDVARAAVRASLEDGQDGLRHVDKPSHVGVEHDVDVLLGDLRGTGD